MKKILILAACVALSSCTAVKGWLAGGPEIEFSAGVGPAKIGLTLNPGKTLITAAEAVTDAAASVVPSDATLTTEAK